MAGDNSDEQAIGESGATAIKSPKPRRLVPVALVLFLLFLAFLICVVSILQKMGAADLFRQYVINPIPESVSHIKVDQPKTVGGYGYVFRFDINRADLSIIINSRSLKETQITDFLSGGSLCFKEKDSHRLVGDMVNVYRSKQRIPSWYTLESWDKRETFALVQKVKDKNTSDIQVLIYNEELGQAFFIVFDYGGDAIWG